MWSQLSEVKHVPISYSCSYCSRKRGAVCARRGGIVFGRNTGRTAYTFAFPAHRQAAHALLPGSMSRMPSGQSLSIILRACLHALLGEIAIGYSGSHALQSA